jgi:mRNA-degrading endonuclease RelE of RelBE toxin-antitoxin system
MPKRPALLKIFYSPQAEDDLFRLNATDDDLDTIDQQVHELARDPGLGDLLLLQEPFLSPSQRLYRFDVGKFKLNCRFNFDTSELEVASVEI